jgi:hypothetical protein
MSESAIEIKDENNLNAPGENSLWRELKEAIQGSEADYTEIKIGKAIFLLAVPMILELIMESTFAVVDIFFVGKIINGCYCNCCKTNR